MAESHNISAPGSGGKEAEIPGQQVAAMAATKKACRFSGRRTNVQLNDLRRDSSKDCLVLRNRTEEAIAVRGTTYWRQARHCCCSASCRS